MAKKNGRTLTSESNVKGFYTDEQGRKRPITEKNKRYKPMDRKKAEVMIEKHFIKTHPDAKRTSKRTFSRPVPIWADHINRSDVYKLDAPEIPEYSEIPSKAEPYQIIRVRGIVYIANEDRKFEPVNLFEKLNKNVDRELLNEKFIEIDKNTAYLYIYRNEEIFGIDEKGSEKIIMTPEDIDRFEMFAQCRDPQNKAKSAFIVRKNRNEGEVQEDLNILKENALRFFKEKELAGKQGKFEKVDDHIERNQLGIDALIIDDSRTTILTTPQSFDKSYLQQETSKGKTLINDIYGKIIFDDNGERYIKAEDKRYYYDLTKIENALKNLVKDDLEIYYGHDCDSSPIIMKDKKFVYAFAPKSEEEDSLEDSAQSKLEDLIVSGKEYAEMKAYKKPELIKMAGLGDSAKNNTKDFLIYKVLKNQKQFQNTSKNIANTNINKNHIEDLKNEITALNNEITSCDRELSHRYSGLTKGEVDETGKLNNKWKYLKKSLKEKEEQLENLLNGIVVN